MLISESDVLLFVNLSKYSTISLGYENDIDKFRKTKNREYFLDLLLYVNREYNHLSYVVLSVIYSLVNFSEITNLDLLLIPILNSQHHDIEIREQCIRCYEHWNDKPALFFLYQFQADPVNWLNEYRNSVIQDIESNINY